MAKYMGIDVSKHNGTINWKAVKEHGVDFAIIRAGYGKVISQKDPKFDENYTGCKNNKIPCGAYWYSYATTVEDARLEANVCLSVIKGKQFELPVYFDMEEKAQVALGKTLSSAIASAFCEVLELNKYWAGLYSFDSFYSSNWQSDFAKRYTCWVARVENVQPEYCDGHDIWQYSWKGKVNGISGDVDLNYCYKDFPSLMKTAGLNGYSNQPDKTYEVSASKAGLSSGDADELAYTLANELKMKTVKKTISN